MKILFYEAAQPNRLPFNKIFYFLDLDSTELTFRNMEDLLTAVVGKIANFLTLFVPSTNFWYSTTFWMGLFWIFW